MAGVVNTNLEKLFFAKIMEEPNQFYKVEPKFFENEQIRLVYEIIREEYIKSKDKIVPSPKQIWQMVGMYDTNKTISKESFKSLFDSNTTDDIQEEWLNKKFLAWKSSKYTRLKIYESIDLIKNMEEVDYDNVMSIVGRLKTNFTEIDSITDDNEDLGGDFDDPEEHKHTISQSKMSSGWSNVDRILTGGWDRSTLNVLMGETNVGKCVTFGTIAKFKNKRTGEIIEMPIGDFYNLIKNSKK